MQASPFFSQERAPTSVAYAENQVWEGPVIYMSYSILYLPKCRGAYLLLSLSTQAA